MKLPKSKFFRFTRKLRRPKPAALPPSSESAKLVPHSADNILPSTKLQYAATSSNAVAQPFAQSSFARLPPELRLQIYEYAFYIPIEEGRYVVTKEDGIPEPALLFTCKSIRYEAIDLFYRKSNFHLMMPSCDPTTEALMTRKEKLLNNGEIKNRRQCYVDGPGSLGNDWKNLQEWLRLYHAGEAHEMAPNAVSLYEGDDVGAVYVEQPFIRTMFKLVAEMNGKPWEMVGELIDGFHCGLVALNRDWRDR